MIRNNTPYNEKYIKRAEKSPEQKKLKMVLQEDIFGNAGIILAMFPLNHMNEHLESDTRLGLYAVRNGCMRINEAN